METKSMEGRSVCREEGNTLTHYTLFSGPVTGSSDCVTKNTIMINRASHYFIVPHAH